MRLYVVTLLALFLPSVSLAADLSVPVPRNIQFTNLTTENGLSSEFVHDVVQDERGFMWFATQAGLNRYDGHDITFYESIADDPTSLSNSFIWSLHVDDNGQLWIGTNNGLNRYDPQTDSFVRDPIPEVELGYLRIRRVFQDSSGLLWLGSLGDGVLLVDLENNTVERFRHDPADSTSLPNDHVLAILEDRRGQVWLGTDGGGIARFDRPTQSFVRHQQQADNPLSLNSDRIRSLYEDSAGRIWVGTAEGGLNLFDASTGRFQASQFDPENPLTIGNGQVSAVIEDDRGTLWVGTESGISEWRPSANGYVRYESNPADRYSLANNRVNAMYQDSSGVLWLGTHGGVSAWNYFSDTFSYYSTVEGFLEEDLVTAMAESSDGTLWIGTYGGGLTRMDLRTESTRHYRYERGNPASLPDDRVTVIHVGADDRVYVGTRSGGLARLNADGETFTRYTHDPDNPETPAGDAITQILSDSSGALWVGVFDKGVDRMAAGTEVFEHYTNDPNDAMSLSGNRVMSIFEDSAGQVWLGTERAGLNRYLADTKRFERFEMRPEPDDPQGTPWEITEARDGTLWIGTMEQGLLSWSAADRAAGNERFERYGPGQGLASEIYGVLEGTAGELWLSSSRGLFRFEPGGSIRQFDGNNGLRTNEFNYGARVRSRSGRILFGTTAGAVGFYPGELPTNSHVPKIELVASSRTAPITLTGSGREIPKVTREYLDPFIAFDFVALDFVSPDKNEYRYRLRGLDNEWTEASQFRRAVYSSLPSGSYTFEVQASNNDGVWNEAGAQIDVEVIPPPWFSWWAYVLYGAIAIGLAGWAANYQRSKQLAEAEMRARLESLVTARTSELAERNSELMIANDKLERASVTDALTGLHNRRFVDEYISGELSKLQRTLYQGQSDALDRESPKMLFLMMIDLDGFKLINDTHGHEAGDIALIEVKERLLATCRQSDIVVRWGGDEFLVIGHANLFEGTKTLAEKIRANLAEPAYKLKNDNYGRLSASIGVAPLPFVEGDLEFSTWEQVAGIADLCAYLAKGNGRNAWISVQGTRKLSHGDVPTLKERFPELVKTGYLEVDSSIEGGLRLNLEATVTPIRA